MMRSSSSGKHSFDAFAVKCWEKGTEEQTQDVSCSGWYNEGERREDGAVWAAIQRSQPSHQSGVSGKGGSGWTCRGCSIVKGVECAHDPELESLCAAEHVTMAAALAG